LLTFADQILINEDTKQFALVRSDEVESNLWLFQWRTLTDLKPRIEGFANLGSGACRQEDSPCHRKNSSAKLPARIAGSSSTIGVLVRIASRRWFSSCAMVLTASALRVEPSLARIENRLDEFIRRVIFVIGHVVNHHVGRSKNYAAESLNANLGTTDNVVALIAVSDRLYIVRGGPPLKVWNTEIAIVPPPREKDRVAAQV
jgi:hypothetical protein